MDGDCLKALDDLVWQPPNAEPSTDAMALDSYSKHDICAELRVALRLPKAWCAFGINLSDSIDRRIYVSKNKGKNPQHMTFYPCWNWTHAMIVNAVRSSGIKLPADYTMASRSMAGVPSYRHLLRMEAMFPDDFVRVELMFPMVRAELARQYFRESKAADKAIATVAPCRGSVRTGEKTKSPNRGDR
jgi:hypothetical protein